jgi:serine protease Do
MTVFRNGASRQVEAVLTAPPENPPRDMTDLAGPQPLAGARVVNLSPAVNDELGLAIGSRGVIILAISQPSTAARLGFHAGDIIAGVNDTPVTGVAQLRQLLTKQPQQWRLQIRRDGKLLSVVFGA